MRSIASPPHRGDGALAGLVRRAAGAAARRPRRTIALWLLLVAGCLVAGSLTGTKSLQGSEFGTGESRRADERISAAGLEQPASESMLVRSGVSSTTGSAARDLERRLASLDEVRRVQGPAERHELSTDGGRTVLVQVELRGDPEDAAEHVAPVQAAAAATGRSHPGVTVQQVGAGSVEKAFESVLAEDLQRAEVFSVPLTLVILVLAFGAFVAALVPLALALTSVAAALGALGVVSQITPVDQSAATLIVLIGLAVGVDYSLFYIRREREERRAGRGQEAALEVAAATVGRAVLVSGMIVIIALAGLLFTGLAVFSSMALATMLVALIAVIGSVTVLPAILSLLGDRIDKGRIPGLARVSARLGAQRGVWARLAAAVTKRPKAALAIAVCLLASLAVPALDLRTASPGSSDLPQDQPVLTAQRAIERTFPGAPENAELVVTGDGLDGSRARRELAAMGRRARGVTGGRGPVAVALARDGRTALVSVPMPDRGIEQGRTAVRRLRREVAPTVGQLVPGAEAMVSGRAAESADFTDRLSSTTPFVIAFVLGLAFLLLVAVFRSAALAASVIGLNLLSVGAAYGLLVAVFQHSWAEGLLGFESTGSIVDWLPLFAFVILFGLSMDYTVLVLERIREARHAGRCAREAAAEGVAATAGTITSAAIIMVAVFGIFATLGLLQFKQFGVGLAAAVLIDATIVRGIALPAVVALLGDRGWRVPHRRSAQRRELAPAVGS